MKEIMQTEILHKLIEYDNKIDEYKKLKHQAYMEALEDEEHARSVALIQQGIYEDWYRRNMRGCTDVIDESMYILNSFQLKNADMYEMFEETIRHKINDIIEERECLEQVQDSRESQERDNG